MELFPIGTLVTVNTGTPTQSNTLLVRTNAYVNSDYPSNYLRPVVHPGFRSPGAQSDWSAAEVVSYAISGSCPSVQHNPTPFVPLPICASLTSALSATITTHVSFPLSHRWRCSYHLAKPPLAFLLPRGQNVSVAYQGGGGGAVAQVQAMRHVLSVAI